ncbi:hypothetical protein E8P82_04420 [Arthrobacter echini]|uniref:Uncharacterized protein n=1 Tax=Arthrobacter echini TaxID=1529066 RepID=A0A4S5E718_9MICC|nr:hypothetical protein [Arthrobacter echini]THJ67358.1 hypothetical protein E8P82_04420 [Arthrobacter echini]
MTHLGGVPLRSQETFGRDGAMFESLLGFVAELSIVLWSLVILTVLLRFVGVRIYRRGARSAPAGTIAPDAAASKAVRADDTHGQDTPLAPAAGASPVRVVHRIPRENHTGSRSSTRVPALASRSTKA